MIQFNPDARLSLMRDKVHAGERLSFEDGLFLVIVDGQEQRSLDAQVYVQPDSRVAFVRLVMLAGG